MKLPELKNRLKNKYTVRIIAGVLVIALAGTAIGTTAYTVKADNNTEAAETNSDISLDVDDILDKVSVSASDADKEESVYIITDASGNVQETIVSDHLTNKKGEATIEDESNLNDISNVKGKETFTQSGSKLTWQADGKEIYYQGTTNEAAPLKQSVKYTLDGKDITPEELAGKSGKVTIRFDYENTTSYTETVNGEEVTVKVPLAAVTTLLLDDNFSNVEVTNGKAKEKGDGNIIIGYALPGLTESLNIDKDKLENLEIPEYFEVTADVTDFSLETAMTFVVNATEYVSMTGSMTDKVDDMIDDLTDATDKLIDGTDELSDGADKLSNGADELSDGAKKVDKGAKTLSDGADKLSNGAKAAAKGASDLASGADTLEGGLKTLNKSLKPFKSGMSSLKTGMDAYLDGSKALNKGIKTLYNGTGSLADGAETINTSAKSISDGIASLDKTLKTPMTDKEKDAVGKKAAKAATATAEKDAVKTVKNKLNDSDNEKNLTNIKAAAKAQYTAKVTSEDSKKAIASNMKSNSQFKNVVKAGVEKTIEETIGEDNIQLAIMGGAPNRKAAIKMCFASAYPGVDYDDYVAGQVNTIIGALADGVADGVAAASADAVGASVAGAVEDASLTVASEVATQVASGVAYQVAISASEETKATVASGIEAEQENGYSLVTGSKALSEGTQTLVDKIPSLTLGVEQLLNGSNKLVANNKKLKSGIKELNDGSGDIKKGVDKLAKGSTTLSNGADALAKGTKDLSTGSKTLAKGAGTLADGTGSLFDGALKLANGADKLADGAGTLASGMVEFNDEGISKIVNAYDGDLKPLANRLQAIIDAGNDYQTFTGIKKDAKGTVKFIYKLGAIEADDAKDAE